MDYQKRERIRYRLDIFFFVNLSYSARDLALCRMVQALWGFWCFSSSGPSNWHLEMFFSSASFRCPWPSIDRIQEINVKTKKDLSFLSFQWSSFPSSKMRGLSTIVIVFISEGLDMSFSHTPDRYWYTVRCGYQNGALILIEGVKNTRKGRFELGFPN